MPHYWGASVCVPSNSKVRNCMRSNASVSIFFLLIGGLFDRFKINQSISKLLHWNVEPLNNLALSRSVSFSSEKSSPNCQNLVSPRVVLFFMQHLICYSCYFSIGLSFCIPNLYCSFLVSFLPCKWLVNTGWLLTLEKVFRNGYVAACSTALRSATEENDSGGHVDVPCSSKLTQHKITADWLKVL